jgi:cysteinyl-tRNA synthetase
MFQTTYRNPLNFSQVLIDQAKENLEKLMRSINTAIINLKLNNIKLKRSKVVSQEFIKAMDRDLNFPNAVTVIIEQVKTFSILFRNKDFTSINSTIDSIFTEFDVLGIKYELKFSKEDLKIIAN